MTGYLIGLYGESDITDEETDLALAAFYPKMISLCMEFLEAAASQSRKNLPEFLEEPDCCSLLEEADLFRLNQQNPEAVQAWLGIDLLSLGLMSRISRSLPMRQALRQEPHLAQHCRIVGSFRGNASFVPYILEMVEKETLLCISPKTGKGVEISLEQIDSNSVLFTLLQFALYHKNLLEPLGAAPFEYRPVIEKLATHQPVEREDYPDQIFEQGCFSYYTYPAYQENGSYNQMQAAWGEGTLWEIPQLDGRYILLLDKPFVQRSWGNAMVCSTHSGLKPKVEILRELSPQEVSEWMEKILAANRRREAPLLCQR